MQRFKDAVVPSTFNPPATSVQVENAEAISSSIHPKAIRPVGALHLTLNVMSLDSAKLGQAIDILHGLDVSRLLENLRSQGAIESTANDPAKRIEDAELGLSSLERPISPPATIRSAEPVKVGLTGLQSMHAPQKTSILYIAPSDPTNRLYHFCQAVLKPFADQGLLADTERALKLHATVVNTIYAKGRQKRPPKREKATEPGPLPNAAAEGEHGERITPSPQPAGEDRSIGHGPNANAPLKIDARGILERFRDFVWAEDLVLDRVAICEMGAKKMFDGEGKLVDEQYTEIACVKLP